MLRYSLYIVALLILARYLLGEDPQFAAIAVAAILVLFLGILADFLGRLMKWLRNQK